MVLSGCHMMAGQDSLTLQIRLLDSTASSPRIPQYRHNHNDTMLLHKALADVVSALNGKGFLEASVDWTETHGNKTVGWLRTGPRYQWLSLKAGHAEAALLNEGGFRSKPFDGEPVHIEQLDVLQKKLLRHMENNGYPFATVFLDSVRIVEGQVSAVLGLTRNELIRIDSIVIVGNAQINPAFLYSYLGVEPGIPYSESAVAAIGSRLKELSFVRQVKQPQLIFVRDGALIQLFLDERKVSRVNGIVGVLPNSVSNDGKLLITGELDLHFENIFRIGEESRLNWNQLKPQSPELNVFFLLPYLPFAPVGADIDFSIYKKDTAYIDIIQQYALRYNFIGRDYLKAFVRRTSSNLITVDTAAIISSHALPSRLDLRLVSYGLQVHRERLDYRFNPRKGWQFTATGEMGNRSVRRNPEITELSDPGDSTFVPSALYDSLGDRNIRGSVAWRGELFIPIAQRMTTMIGVAGAAQLTNGQLLENELLRLGGANFFRGFDEESFLASWFQMIRLEWRYLLAANSYFAVFGDAGYFESQSLGQSPASSWPLGFGAGLAFETRAGVFGVNYALGRLLDEAVGFRFRNAKVHVGYVAFF